jgi:hypothetical protein
MHHDGAVATRLTYDLTYDAPLTDVGEMLMEPAFREQVCDAIGCVRKEVTIGPDGGRQKVVVDMVQATQGIPGFAKKFVGDEINIVQREKWASTEEADLTVTIPGKPGEMTGTITLVESGGTTTETVDVGIKVNIPLVGGKIEALISGLLQKALVAENEAGRDYLSR